MDIQTIVDHHGNAPPIGSKRTQSSKAVNPYSWFNFLVLVGVCDYFRIDLFAGPFAEKNKSCLVG
jgi:hypothetical protein